MNGKLLKVITSILIILTMTIGNFAIICANVITYAVRSYFYDLTVYMMFVRGG